MTTMRAAMYRTTGDAATVLEVVEVPVPEPGPGQVRVRVAVSAINPTDVKIRSGFTPRPIDGYQIPHMDGAGVIDAVGEGVDPARVGERAWLLLAAHEGRQGTAAEFCVVPAARAIRLPDGISWDLAATLGVPAVTAAHCLFASGAVAGQDILVAGGAGAVGRAAVQLARWGGARVAATVSTPEKASVALAAGAGITVDYRDASATARLRDWSPGFHRIVEVSLAANAAMDAELAAPGAVIVVYSSDGGDPVLPVRTSLLRSLTYQYVLLYNLTDDALRSATQLVSAALEERALDMPPAIRFPVDRMAAAHRAVEARVPARVLVDVAEVRP